jgi:hypothetical protein
MGSLYQRGGGRRLTLARSGEEQAKNGGGPTRRSSTEPVQSSTASAPTPDPAPEPGRPGVRSSRRSAAECGP